MVKLIINFWGKNLPFSMVILGLILQFTIIKPEIILVEEGFTSKDISREMEILEDKEKKIKFTEILNEKQNSFKPSLQKSPNLGFTESAFWIKIELQKQENIASEYYLLLPYHILDNVQFYEQKDGGYNLIQTGSLYPFRSRGLDFRLFAFKISLRGKRTQTYYLRLETESSFIIPLELLSPEEFQSRYTKINLVYGIYYGVIIAMFFYNLFIFISTRDKSYLYYILFIVSYGLLQFVGNGYAYQYLWSNSPEWGNISMTFFMGVTIFFGSIFSLNFLEIRKHQPLLYSLLVIIAFLSLTIIPSVFICKVSTSSRYAIIIGIIAVILIFLSAIQSLKKKIRSARFFLIAWLFFLIGAVLALLRLIGILPINFATLYSIQIGSLLEVLLLSFALADKINILKKEKEEAILNLLKTEATTNQILEENITNRTKELNKSLQAVQKDIKIASQIQRSILTKDGIFGKFRVSSKYIPLDLVGGDYYNVFLKSQGEIRVFLADATGHGVQAGMITMTIHSEYKRLRDKISDPGNLLYLLNERFFSIYSSINVYFSCILIDINLKNKTLTYFSAGHPAQIFLQNNKMNYLEKTGHLIGIHSKKNFNSITENFNHGDKVLLFTDGIFEEFNKAHEEFGETKLHKYIEKNKERKIPELFDGILNELDSFLESNNRKDDITLIGIESFFS